MKLFVFLFALIGASLAQNDFYTTANDNFDMQSLVDDPNKLQEFVDCFLERRPCDVIPGSYLAIIPDSIQGACRRCNPNQKHLANTFLTGLRNKNPAEYQNFVNKYDPEGKYMNTFLDSVRGY